MFSEAYSTFLWRPPITYIPSLVARSLLSFMPTTFGHIVYNERLMIELTLMFWKYNRGIPWRL